MTNWLTASLASLSAHLDTTMARQQQAFPAPTAATYAAEQRAPDPEDELEDMG